MSFAPKSLGRSSRDEVAQHSEELTRQIIENDVLGRKAPPLGLDAAGQRAPASDAAVAVSNFVQRAYYSPKRVTMTGPTEIYMRGDRMLEMHRCKTCGCVMWWVPVDKSYDRMGVNARMLPLGAWDATPVKKLDGASW